MSLRAISLIRNAVLRGKQSINTDDGLHNNICINNGFQDFVCAPCAVGMELMWIGGCREALFRVLLKRHWARNAQCVATRGRNRRVVSYDRVIATCRIGGRRIGDAPRAAGAREGGN